MSSKLNENHYAAVNDLMGMTLLAFTIDIIEEQVLHQLPEKMTATKKAFIEFQKVVMEDIDALQGDYVEDVDSDQT